MQETQFDSWVGKIPWRRGRLPTPVFMGVPGSSDGKESTCNAGFHSCVGKIALEEGMTTHSSVLAWRTPLDRGAWWATVHGPQRVRRNWVTKHSHSIIQKLGEQAYVSFNQDK